MGKEFGVPVWPLIGGDGETGCASILITAARRSAQRQFRGMSAPVLSRRWWKSGRRDLRRGEVTTSRGEIDRLIGERRGEGVPAVDLAHDDLPRGQQSPEERGRGLGLGQDGSRVLMRRLNSSCSRSMALVVRADFHWPGGRRVKVKSRSPASSRLSATMSHVAPLVRATMANALQPPLAEERLAAGFHLGGGLGVDHVAVVLGELVVEPLRCMREQSLPRT